MQAAATNIRLVFTNIDKYGILYFMSKEISAAYHLAENLFYGFREETDLFTQFEVADSGVVQRLGHMTNVEGVEAWGEVDSRHVRQRLSLGKRGIYFLTTTDLAMGGRVDKVGITTDSDNGLFDLEKSTFVLAMNDILSERSNKE